MPFPAVAASDEVRRIVQALERKYDVAATGRGERSSLGLSGELPSADELAAEVEKFLADRDDDGQPGGEPTG